MSKQVTIIGSSLDFLEDLRNKLSRTGLSVRCVDLNTAGAFLAENIQDLLILDLVCPFEKCRPLIQGVLQNDPSRQTVIFCLIEPAMLEKHREELYELHRTYPLKKLFPKPFLPMDIVEAVHREFFPSEKSPRMIMVVDDSPERIERVSEAIAPFYRVLSAAPGRHSLMAALEETPDLILLGPHMPSSLQAKTCSDLKSFYPTEKTPVLTCLDSDEPVFQAKMLLAGAGDFLCGEVSRETLRKKIDQFLKSNYIVL